MKFLLEGEETERLQFRLLNEDDFTTWLDFFDGKDVAKFILLNPALSKNELCEAWFKKVFNRYKNQTGGMNALIDKKSGEFIGQCGLLIQNIENIEYLEVGYSILPKYWKMGYAKEAAIKCKNYAFENNFRNELVSIIHKENVGSQKVAIHNGMKLIKSNLNKPNQDFNLFGITIEDWKLSQS